jgi:hypothetical protein
MSIIFRIKEFFALRKAKAEEGKHIPDEVEIRRQDEEFKAEAKELDSLTTKKYINRRKKRKKR